MSLKELLKLNPNIKNPDRIDIGQKIKLKQDGSAPPAYLLRENNKREKINLPTIQSTASEKFIPEKPKQKIKNREYKIDINKQQASITPIVSLFNKLFSSSKTPESYDSKNKNLQAIIDHKVRFNVNDPYVVIDKENNLMKIMQKDKVLEEYEITTSLNKGDGWFKLQGHEGLPKMPRTTGAGIFTIRGSQYSEYPRDKNTKEPMFRLYQGNENTTMAVHEPVNAKRRSLFNNKNKCDNRTSYGCISPKPGVVGHLFKDKVIQNGDSLYVLPEIEGNYIHEKQGQLQTHYGKNNPSTFITQSGFKGNFRYNNK